MPYYSVLTKAFASVVVEAETPEEAMEIVVSDVSRGDLQHDSTEIEYEIKPEALEANLRHADKVLLNG